MPTTQQAGAQPPLAAHFYTDWSLSEHGYVAAWGGGALALTVWRTCVLHGTGHELLYGAPAQAAWLASTHCQCACWHRATPHEEGTPDMSCWHLGMWPVLSRLRAQRADRGLIQFRGRACYVCLRSNIGTGQRCRLIPEDGPGRLVTADQSCSIIFLLLCCHCAWHLCGCWSR